MPAERPVSEVITLDDLHGYHVDEAQEQENAKLLLLPKGRNYQTVPPLKLDMERIKGEGLPAAGRIMLRLFGQVDDGNGNKGSIGFRLSPDLKLTNRGRPDNATRLYLNAKKALQRAGGEYTGPQSIAQYLRDYPVKLSITILDGNADYPDPSNFVTSIQPPAADGVPF